MSLRLAACHSPPALPAETPRRLAPDGRTARPPRPVGLLPRRPAPRACPAQHHGAGRPHWRLTPALDPAPLFHSALCFADFADAPVPRRRGSIRETGEGRRPRRREPGQFRSGYDAPACASGPSRSLAELTAAPKVCLTSVARAPLWAYRLATPPPATARRCTRSSKVRAALRGRRTGRRRPVSLTSLAAWHGGT